MRLRNSILLPFLFSALLLLLLTACSPAVETQAPTLKVVKETVLVVVTPTPEPDTATPTASTVPTAASLTGTPSPAPKATATATLRPSPTPLLLLNVPIEGGDPNHAFYVQLVYPDYQPATTSLWFRVYAHEPVSSKVDGQGIDSVEFTITNSKNVQVHYREEKTAGYCAFGGGEPDCVVWNFASHNYTWPDGAKITSGTYNLHINATDKDQFVMFGDIKFRIQVP